MTKSKVGRINKTFLLENLLSQKVVGGLIHTVTYVSAKKIGGSANALWRTLMFHKSRVH